VWEGSGNRLFTFLCVFPSCSALEELGIMEWGLCNRAGLGPREKGVIDEVGGSLFQRVGGPLQTHFRVSAHSF